MRARTVLRDAETHRGLRDVPADLGELSESGAHASGHATIAMEPVPVSAGSSGVVSAARHGGGDDRFVGEQRIVDDVAELSHVPGHPYAVSAGRASRASVFVDRP
jgi:hypothetical protein